jgi:hypothetical protein
MSREIVFGSRGAVVYLRIVQLVLIVAAFLLRPQTSEPLASWLIVIPFTVAEAVLYRVVFARLTEDGMEYRRWGKWKSIVWTDMERVSRHPSIGTISLEIANRRWWNKYLLLGRPNPPLSDTNEGNGTTARLNALIAR